MTFGAAKSAQSYWSLRDAEQYCDLNVIGRTLLERVVNSIVAGGDPISAVALIARELNHEIESIKKWTDASDVPLTDLNRHRDERIAELTRFEALLPDQKYKRRWSIFERFKKAGIELTYRSAYAHLCSYVHAGYHSAVEDAGICDNSDYFALMAPVETAFRLHGATGCTDDPCPISAEYQALAAEISAECFPENNQGRIGSP